MGKYRKKPVVIEAMQLTETNLHSVMEFAGEKPDLSLLISQDRFEQYKEIVNKRGYLIETLEGIMTANTGDYIIKGIKGEFYPCKPDIFEQTYDLVEK